MKKQYTLSLFLLSALLLAGCNESGLSQDEKEEREPLVKTGVAYLEQEAWEDAEAAFKEALDKDPLLAKPHLELAQIYQQNIPNFVHAYYHYDRYLELRPSSEKADMIRRQQEKILQAVAIKAINDLPQFRESLEKLQAENAKLKRQLAAAQRSATPTPSISTTPAPVQKKTAPQQKTTTAPTKAPAQAVGHKIYTVAKGDTLSKIANKFYGDSTKSDIIFDANRDSLANPNALRIGQTLIIPLLKK